jgi:hypothetical protein
MTAWSSHPFYMPLLVPLLHRSAPSLLPLSYSPLPSSPRFDKATDEPYGCTPKDSRQMVTSITTLLSPLD